MTGSIALRRAGLFVEAVSLQQAGRRHAQTLVAEVDALLRRAGVSPQQLNVVAVSIGPGSFTGLRVGVVFAKALAYAVGCQLAAVDTFRAIAAASPADVSEVFVLSDAQRGDLFVGNYAVGDSASGPTQRSIISIESSKTFCQRISATTDSQWNIAISGPAAAKLRSVLPQCQRVLASEHQHPRAEFVAMLGEQQVLAGERSDPWLLEPFYLRRVAAEEKADS